MQKEKKIEYWERKPGSPSYLVLNLRVTVIGDDRYVTGLQPIGRKTLEQNYTLKTTVTPAEERERDKLGKLGKFTEIKTPEHPSQV